MIKDLPFFGMLGEKMKWLNQRQRVIAQNIANSDTPLYNAKDLKPLDFRATLRSETARLPLARTNDRHLTSKESPNAYRIIEERASYETSASGNSVVLEEQMVNMNSVSHQHDLATKITRKYLQMYNMALGKRN